MDLELHEALALSGDRSAAIGRLLPGSEDHDYYRCLRAQHAGALDEADEILRAWPERHGGTQRYERLRLRQLLYRTAGAAPVSLFRLEGVTRDAADVTTMGHRCRIWSRGGHTYVLVAPERTSPEIARIARYVQQEAR
jgi:hypothetical protein